MLEGLAAVGVFSLTPDGRALTRHKGQSFALIFVFSDQQKLSVVNFFDSYVV
jgi:hypothetical protein